MLMTEGIMEGFGVSYRHSNQASHLVQFLDRDEGRPAGDPAGRGTGGAVTARNLSFTYPGTEAVVVDDVNVDLAPGTTVALVGANGAGKTTLAKLLLGLYVPTGGDVIRGTVNTRDATRHAIRERTSAVFQNYQRYRMTLRDNVVLADATRAGDERAVLRALERGGVPAELWQGEEGLELMLSREFGDARPVTRAVAAGRDRPRAVPGARRDPARRADRVDRPAGGTGGVRAVHGDRRRPHGDPGHAPAGLGTAGRPDPGDAGRPHHQDGTHERLLERRGLYHEMFTAQSAWYRRGD